MKYRNVEPPYEPQGLREVVRWALVDRFMGRRLETPRRVRIPRADPDLALLASDSPSLTWVGHATFLARLDGVTLCFDPVWSTALGPGLRRNASPGIALDSAPSPDLVLVSHNHRDHLDEPTIRAIEKRAKGRATYVCGEGLGSFFRSLGCARVVELPWWGEHAIEARHGPLTVAFVPSQHWSQRGPFDRNDTLWGGFVATGGGRRLYHSGDTAWFGGFAEIGRRYPGIDAAMLPIGGYEPEWFMRRQHMNPEDAVRAFRSLGARLLCAMHFGTFKLTDEPLDEPPRLLEEARARDGLERERVWVPAIGETRAL